MKNFKTKIKNMKGITLIALVVTIIVLLILAGVTVATLMGENGLFARAKTAAEENRKAEAIEDVKLKIMEVQAVKEGNATLEDLVEYLENNTTNEYKITKVSSGTASLVEGSIESSEVGNAEKIYITSVKYGYEVEVNSNMTVTERVVASSLGGQSSSESGSGSGEVTGGVSQEEYDSLEEEKNTISTEYENFRKAISQSIEDAGGTATSYNANATTFDTNIKGILTEATKDATATKDKILDGYTAYVNGSKVIGENNAITKVLLRSNLISYSPQTVSATSIPNYQNLTKDNFFVEFVGAYLRGPGGISTWDDVETISISYNASSGQLSLGSGAYHDYGSYPSTTGRYQIYIKYNVYCIY